MQVPSIGAANVLFTTAFATASIGGYGELAMQRCPKCGYREGVNWPVIVWNFAFGLLYIVFILGADNAPKVYRPTGLLDSETDETIANI